MADQKIKVGKAYKLDQANSSQYICLSIGLEVGTYVFMRIGDGWKFIAHGAKLNEKDLLSWEFSTKGHFPKEQQ